MADLSRLVDETDLFALGGWTGPEILPHLAIGESTTEGHWVVTRLEDDGGSAPQYSFTCTPIGEILRVNLKVAVDRIVNRDSFIRFHPGTRIRTPTGEVAVETLGPGDLVLTEAGEARPVRFLFRQTVAPRFAAPRRTLPIRITAGALYEGLPVRDLLISPAHAALVDGVLVRAGALVNGTTVMWDTSVPEVFTDWHIGLADHALVLAGGVPAETFLDSSNREAFDNRAQDAALVADLPPVAEMALPRAKSHRQVRARLAARAAALRRLAAA